METLETKFAEFMDVIKKIAMSLVAASDKEKAFDYFVENFTDGEIDEMMEAFVRSIIDQSTDDPAIMFMGDCYLDEEKMEADFEQMMADSEAESEGV